MLTTSSGTRYCGDEVEQPADRVGQQLAGDLEQHEPPDRADHVEHGEHAHPHAGRAREQADRVVGDDGDQRQAGLGEPPLERAHELAVGGGAPLHPRDGGVAVPATEEEEQGIGGEEPQRADHEVADRVDAVGHEDEVAVARAEDDQQERVVVDERGEEGAAGVVADDEDDDRRDDRARPAGATVAGARRSSRLDRSRLDRCRRARARS